ncbi:MAG: LysR family transcriptional regulator [Oscillospiraceae bacterium]|jgi:LysR family transcriptional activator of glutamate synthase operon
MKLSQLEYVYEVSCCGSMTAAANKLFVTQPTLSQQIMNLENELGVKLFVRLSRSVIPTPAGEEFLIYAKRILSDVEKLKESMADYSSLRRGKVRIGMLSTFGCFNIINKLAIFKKENPTIDTRITVSQSKHLVEMMMSHQLDVAFIMASNPLPDEPRLQLTKLFDSEMMALMPNGHPLGEKSQITFADLAKENIIMPSRSSTLYASISAGFHNLGIEPHVISETSHPELFIQMVANGMGIAFASERVVAGNRHHSFLARPLVGDLAQSIYFAVLEDTYEVPSIRCFSDYIIREYTMEPGS